VIYFLLVFVLLLVLVVQNVHKAYNLYFLNKKVAVFIIHALLLITLVYMIIHMFERVFTILDLRFEGLAGIEGPGG